MNLVSKCQILRNRMHMLVQQIKLFLENGPPNNPFDLNPALVAICVNSNQLQLNSDPFDGFLWAVQKNRRSLEARLKRKFGDYKLASNSKMLKLRQDLTICQSCGSWHELNFVCAVCYKKVKEETRKVQKLIVEKLGLSPVDQEIELKYQDETSQFPNRVLVEVDEPRPNWFSPNLLAKTGLQDPNEIRPSISETLNVKVK